MATSPVTLVIASTTSTQNSGLFDVLIPAFGKEAHSRANVKVIAVGTGQAMRLAKKMRPTCSLCTIHFGRKNLLPMGTASTAAQ